MSQANATPFELYWDNLRRRNDLEKEAKELVWKILSPDMRALALDAFSNDIDVACEWMIRRHRHLYDKSPIDMIIRGEIDWVSTRLQAIIHGIFL